LKLATFNARAETVAEKPFFREAFKRNRCLIPVSAYYEWEDTPDGKQPWYFTARDGSPALTAEARARCRAGRRSPGHQWDRACSQERMPPVRLPARIRPADNHL
jgi:putative SOS response-associated peptidase YedK